MLYYIHTYIHVRHYKPSARFTAELSQRLWFVCVNFIIDYNLYSITNNKFFEKHFIAILFTLIVFTIFCFASDVWPVVWTVSSRLTCQNTTY